MLEINSILKYFAFIFLIIGAVECFAGFKFIKTLILVGGSLAGIFLGYIVGVSAESMILSVAMAIILGILFVIILSKFLLVGVFILITLLAVIGTYMVFQNAVIAFIAAITVFALTICFEKDTIIITTSISGAEILLYSAHTMMNLSMNRVSAIVIVFGVITAILGIAVQYITTTKEKMICRKTQLPLDTVSSTSTERRYPGMQKSYRNFCIKCGCEVSKPVRRCPRCGYNFDN